MRRSADLSSDEHVERSVECLRDLGGYFHSSPRQPKDHWIRRSVMGQGLRELSSGFGPILKSFHDYL
jgi:hypothetical protein